MQEAIHHSGRTLAICDDPAAVNFLLGRGEKIDHWLALTPPTAVALNQKRLDYLIADNFFDEADLLGNLDDRLNLQVEWALWVDDYLRKRIPEFRREGLAPAFSFFHSFNTFFDRLRVKRFSVNAVLTAYRPEKVLWVSTYASIMRERYLIGAHYVDMVLPALARELGIEIRVFPLGSADQHAMSDKLNILQRAMISLKKSHAVKLARRTQTCYQGWRLSRQRRKESRSGPALHRGTKVLVLQDIYDMAYVLPELLAAGVKLVYPDLQGLKGERLENRGGSIETALQDAWEGIIREEQFWSPLEGWESGREIAKPWLHGVWRHAFRSYWQGFRQSAAYLARDRYQAVIVANTQGLDYYATGIGFLHAARRQGIPIFTSLHGTLPGYCHQPVQVFMDMPFSDYHFVYGTAVVHYLKTMAGRYPIRHATALAGGSMRIDALRQAYRPETAARLRRKMAGSDRRPLILYIPNFLFYHRRLTGDGYACMPYFELQRQIMELFSKFPQVRVVYRSYPSQWPDLVPNLAKSRISDLIIVTHRDCKLSELMWAVDAVILDYPATPLGEVLLTKKPLVVFSDRRYYQMTPEAKSRLQKRAQVAETPAEYLSAIEQFLTGASFKEIEDPDDEFLHLYVTDGNQGGVASQIAEKILQVIADGHP